MKVLRWISRNIKKVWIQNEESFLKIGVTLINENMESHLRWFGHM
jgi:hypothetical protein